MCSDQFIIQFEPDLKEPHHVKVFNDFAEVGVLSIVLNLLRLNHLPRTLHPNLRFLHLEQVHTLQVSQTPVQHLQQGARVKSTAALRKKHSEATSSGVQAL